MFYWDKTLYLKYDEVKELLDKIMHISRDEEESERITLIISGYLAQKYKESAPYFKYLEE